MAKRHRLMSASKSFYRWLPIALGVLASLTLIGSGVKVPNPQATAVAETTILSFSSSEEFLAGDIVGSNIAISFEGRLSWPNGDVLDEFQGTLLLDPPEGTSRITTIQGFEIAADSTVIITVDERENITRFEFAGPRLELSIVPATDAIAIASGYGCDESECTRKADGRNPVRIRTIDNSSVQIVIRSPHPVIDFANLIPVDQLDFWDVQSIDGAIQKRSGLQTGTLRFLATPDLHHEFQRGEIISVTPSELVMRSVEVSASLISSQFSGEVGDIRAQIGTSTYSLKPNFLEMVSRISYVRYGIALMAFIFGAGLTINFSKRKNRKNRKAR